MTSRRRIDRRWAAPAIALVAIAGITAGPNLLRAADASPPNLPPLTPAELLVKARTAQVTALSGTVQLTSDLGLPSLESLGALGGGGSGTSVASLLSGTHSAQVWMDGADRVRIATSAPLEETNWVRNGSDVWSYDSSTLTATHVALPADATASADGAASTSSLPDPVHDTPVAFAQALLDQVTPSTGVTVDATKTVAGRPTYQLVLSPNAADSTIGRVTFAVDAATGLPLDVRVTAKSTGATALEIGFSHITFAAPDASTFEFTPPPDAKVVEGARVTDLLGVGGRERMRRRQVADPQAPQITPTAPLAPNGGDAAGIADRVTTVGSDWTTVAVVSGATIPSQLGPLLQGADRFTVGTTSGRVISTTLFTVLVLDDGRVAVGAVQPAAMEALVAGVPA